MRKQKPFFKNSIANIFKNKIQFVTVIILIFVTSLIFTMCYTATTRINGSYKDFISEKNSNLHDFVGDLSNSNFNSESNDDPFKDVSVSEIRDNLYFSYLENKLKNTENEFYFDRVEARTFSLSSGKTFKTITLNPDQQVDRLVVEEGMSIDTWKQYTLATNNLSTRWAYIDKRFANENNIKINDIIRLEDDNYGTSVLVKDSEIEKVDLTPYAKQDINTWFENSDYNTQNWFQVVGFGSSADYVAPIVDGTKVLPNIKNESLVYVNPLNFGINTGYYETLFPKNNFGLTDYSDLKIWYRDNWTSNEEKLRVMSSNDKEVYFVGKFAKSNDISSSVNILNNYISNFDEGQKVGLKSFYQNNINPDKKLVTQINDKNYLMSSRETMYHTVITLFNVVLYSLMAVILLIGVIILVAQLKSQIEKSFSQMGVLISLGYKKSQLIISSSLYPLIIALTGGVLGYAAGIPIQQIIVNIFLKFFSVQITAFIINWETFVFAIFGIFLILELITLITYWTMFNKFKPLEMINFESRNSTNKFNLIVKKAVVRNKKKFNQRFSGAIFSGSIMKIIAVAAALFAGSTMITVGTIIPKVMKDNKTYMFNGDEYDNKLEYYSPLYNSPTSFYKTYNPSVGNTNVDEMSVDQLVDMYAKNQISGSLFTPSNDLGELNDTTYKNINLDYLKRKELELSGSNNKNLLASLTNSLWPDLFKYVRKDWLLSKQSFMDVLFDNVKSKENVNDLENLRLFYLKYRNTIGLNIRRDGYFEKIATYNIIDRNGGKNNNLISNAEFMNFANTSMLIRLDDDGRISDDEDLEKSLYQYIEKDYRWLSDEVQLCGQIYNWIVAFFGDNLQQAFLQGVYTSAPTTVRENINKEFNKDNGQFNVLFGLTPFNKNTDFIGTYIKSIFNGESFNIYGVENGSYQKLYDKKNNDLISELNDDNSIVINQTLAKKLGLGIGQNIDIENIIDYLSINDKELDVNSWDTTTISAEDKETKNTSSKNIYKNSLLNSDLKGWTNKELKYVGEDESANDKEANLPYYSKIDLNSDNSVSPTNMSKLVQQGNVKIANKSIKNTYHIVGIAEQYGESKAWINNDQANIISNYDKIKPILFSVFIKEWLNPVGQRNESVSEFIQKLQSYDNKSDNYESNYKDFVEWTKEKEENNEYLKLFENEYPVFNYKISTDKSFTDLTKGITTIQRYGDYSVFGLKGGTISGNRSVSYAALAQSGIENAWQYDSAIDILDRINKTLNAIIYILLGIVLLISGVAILLTINSIIFKNQKIIAVMKILGYSEKYIFGVFVGMYIPVAIFGALLGFAVGWFTLSGVMGVSIANILLPFNFYIWYLAVGVLGTLLLYFLSVIISWNALKKVSMLIAVQGG
ncbi:ABC transporter permease [Spiroplasma helicoides]|uniref:ABC transporter permease n=1 Tax=Spiroplasma helicoides TaxID=216938 RepID=A0A1B3SJH2_9MOLU|nr:ABC transporter permease [Spiroplasma helicoides]AOG60086.1 ABC transporter permease [Spiroplasma helicoides]